MNKKIVVRKHFSVTRTLLVILIGLFVVSFANIIQADESPAQDATQFGQDVDQFQSPDWAKNAIIYHVFVDRFFDGNPDNNESGIDELPHDEQLKNWMGGDLLGVQQKLDYIEDLGVNTIWLSPVYAGPYSHGYYPTDLKGVDERFGDEELLKEIIDEAHERGLKIVYDFVSNYTSNQHPFFQDALEHGENSEYYNWYTFHDWPNDYETFYGIGELPELNNENLETRAYMLEDVLPYWLFELDFDGFRLDYVPGQHQDFWVDFRQEIKQRDPDKYIFGEIWDHPNVIQSYVGQLDGAHDFALYQAFQDVFVQESGMDAISRVIANNSSLYHPEYVLTTFLDNHNVPRFMYEVDEQINTVKLASALQLTLPGSPIIYYGNEVGLSQSGDHNEVLEWQDRFYREMMLWDEEDQYTDLQEHYKQLIQLRHAEPALRTGEYQELFVTDDLLVFERRDENKQFIVIVNIGNDRQLNLNDLYDQEEVTNVMLSNVFNSEDVYESNGQDQLQFTASEQSFAIYEVSGDLIYGAEIESEIKAQEDQQQNKGTRGILVWVIPSGVIILTGVVWLGLILWKRKYVN